MSNSLKRYNVLKPLAIFAGAFAVAVLAHVLFAQTAASAPVLQEPPAFVLPGWFLGAIPVIAWFLNTVLFKTIESGTGTQFDSTTKRIVVMAICLAMAAGLILSGSVALPAPIPSEPDPVAWGAWILLIAGYAWAGATSIFAAVEAAKALLGTEKAKATPPHPV